MIHFACPACAKALKVKPELTGKKVKCPKCGQAALVPAGAVSPVPASGSVTGSAPAEEKTRAPNEVPAQGAGDQPTLPPAESKTLAPRQKEDTQLGKMPDPSQAEDSADDCSLTDFLAPAEQPDEIGRLGSYRILKVLGAGGMGVVFKAEDPGLQRLVAIKAMLPAIAASASAKKRFLREARTAAGIKHNHIVTIHQVGEDRGLPFLAMEFLEGEPLDDRLKRETTLPIAEVVRIGREMAEGLAAAHAKGLIHRDIKPANTWLESVASGQMSVASEDKNTAGPLTTGQCPLTTASHVKILDFGLARSMTDQTHLTQSGAIIGTPAYMAPEQAGGREVDHRCDLFSLGCVLYRMSTGQLPFKGNDTISILSAIALETPPAPNEVRAEVPAELSELIMRLLAKKADDRPASAQEVAEALRAIAADDLASGGRKPPDTSTRPKKDRTVVHKLKEQKTQQMPALTPRKRWLLPAGVAAFVVAAGLIAFLILGRGTTGPEHLNQPPPNDNSMAVAHDSPFDQLDPKLIPASEKFPWQPKELVALIGTHARRTWLPIKAPDEYHRPRSSPDGKWIVTRHDKTQLCFWDAATRTEKFWLRMPSQIDGLAFVPGKFQLVLCSYGKLKLVDWTAGPPKVVPWPAHFESPDHRWENLQCSRDGSLLTGVVGINVQNREMLLGVWEIRDGVPQFRHQRKITFLISRFSSCLAEEAKLLAYIVDNKSFLCDPIGPELKELAVLDHEAPPKWIHISPDGKVFAVGFESNVGLWRWDGKSLVKWKQLDLTGNGITIQFSPDNSHMVSQHQFGEAQIWKIEKDGPVRRGKPIVDGGSNVGVCFTGDGKNLFAAHNLFVRFWDIQGDFPKELDPPDFAVAPWGGDGGKPTYVAENGLISYFSGDRNGLASYSNVGQNHLWQATGTHPRALTNLPCDLQRKHIIALSPRGHLAAVWDKQLKRIQIMKRNLPEWDMVADMNVERGIFEDASRGFDTSGKALFSLENHAEQRKVRGLDLSVTPAEEKDLSAIPIGPYAQLILSGDGRWLGLIGQGQNAVRFLLWDLKTNPPSQAKEWRGSGIPALSPQGDFLAIQSDNKIHLWDLRNKTIKELESGPASFNPNSLSFSPDDKTLAAAGEIDGEPGHLILFEVPSMKIKQQFTPFPGPIHSVHFADDRHLVTHNGNRTLYILRLVK